MPKIALGCQTITWSNERKEKSEYIVQEVAKAGYEGLEIGARFLDIDKPAEFKDILDKNNIKLVSIHTAGDFNNPRAVEDNWEIFDKVIEFAKITEAPYIVTSGKKSESKTTDEIITNAKQFNIAGKKCKEHNITFCYHNHYWEIQDNARELVELEKNTDSELVFFCPDIGWIRKTTPDVIKTLEVMELRIRIVHFKDYLSDNINMLHDETEFGKGIVDFQEAFDFLKNLKVEELWVFAEQSCSANNLKPEESIKANYEFLKKFV